MFQNNIPLAFKTVLKLFTNAAYQLACISICLDKDAFVL